MKKAINIFITIIFVYQLAGTQISDGFLFSGQCSVATYLDSSAVCQIIEEHNQDDNHCSCNHHPQPVKTLDAVVESRIATSDIPVISVLSLFSINELLTENFIKLTHNQGSHLGEFNSGNENRQAFTGCFLC